MRHNNNNNNKLNEQRYRSVFEFSNQKKNTHNNNNSNKINLFLSAAVLSPDDFVLISFDGPRYA